MKSQASGKPWVPPFYVERDGRPMGETPCHVRNICYLMEPLKRYFDGDPQVFVAGAMVLHYERGRRDRYLSPDVFVVRGVPKKSPRRSYLVGALLFGPCDTMRGSHSIHFPQEIRSWRSPWKRFTRTAP
jgi:hypothetical protein